VQRCITAMLTGLWEESVAFITGKIRKIVFQVLKSEEHERKITFKIFVAENINL
jgi:hypothetical protein